MRNWKITTCRNDCTELKTADILGLQSFNGKYWFRKLIVWTSIKKGT
jgi:hypothetical protein